MKKIATLLGVIALGAASAMAHAPLPTGVLNNVKVTGAKPALLLHQQQIKAGNLSSIAETATRSYVDASGNVYEATFQLDKEPICNLLGFADEQGNPMTPTFDELPYYCVHYTLMRTKPSDTQPSTYITFELVWPSNYIYEQVFDWKGETDENGKIPVALRDYAPTSFSALWNNSDRCRIFRESDGVGVGDPTDDKTQWTYYTMLPNAQLGMMCIIDKEEGYTDLDPQTSTYSQLIMNSFDEEEMYMDFNNRIYIRLAATGAQKILRPNYQGVGEVEGYFPTTVDIPEFGDLHLFNTGLVSSEILQDLNPYPGDFGDLTQFFFVIGDEKMNWDIDPQATVFDEKMIVNAGVDVPEAELRDHANYVQGYAYADAKYAKDTSLNPEQEQFQMKEYDIIEISDDERYAYFVPSVGCLVPFNVGDMNGNREPWAEKYGLYLLYRNMSYTADNPASVVGWGFTEGFVGKFANEYMKTYNATSTGKLIYHYDPKNMKASRELSLVGGKVFDSVESVAADQAKVYAANGVITVVANEAANVAVYGLDGVCLSKANVAAGETVNVEAQKGIYVVTVNGASTKVAL